MKLKLLRFLLILLVLSACRNDHLQDLHYQEEGAKSKLVSKIISLNESVHKHKLLPQLKAAKQNIKTTMPKNIFGKMVSFGDSISIDTDHVIYIENGPNYHTYTFTILRENPLQNAPLENLVLSLLPDGSYQELLVTYDLTFYEKQQLHKGLQINTDGKVTFSELSIGTFNNGQLLQARTFCNYVSHSVVIPCSETNSSTGQPVHHEGNMSTWHHCTADMPPQHIIVGYWNCVAEPVDETLMPTDPGGSGGGGGEGEDPGTPPDDTECSPVADDPNEVGIMDPNGCIPGIPTQPNLPNPKNNPCEKTKQMLQSPNVQEKIAELKEKSKTKGEKGFKVALDGTPSAMITGGENSVNLGDKMGYQGGYHNHTPTGIKIFAPEDIESLLEFSIYQGSGGHNSVFLGMIGSDVCSSCPGGYKYYHYLIRYTGDYAPLNQLVNYPSWDIQVLVDTYRERHKNIKGDSEHYDYQLETLSNKGLEKLFFDTIKDMGLENKISLQRVDESGAAPNTTYTVQNITLNADNKPVAIPCP